MAKQRKQISKNICSRLSISMWKVKLSNIRISFSHKRTLCYKEFKIPEEIFLSKILNEFSYDRKRVFVKFSFCFLIKNILNRISLFLHGVYYIPDIKISCQTFIRIFNPLQHVDYDGPYFDPSQNSMSFFT